MNAFLSNLHGLDLFFFLCAFAGGLLLVIRMLLVSVGLGHHDVDTSGLDGHMAGSFGDTDHHGDSDTSFRLLSLQGLTIFFLIFGLGGLALHRGSHLGEMLSLWGGMVAGVLMVFVIGMVIQMMQNLQSSGTTDLRLAVGHAGTVYLTIPPGGTGKVRVTFQQHMRILDAVAECMDPIRTGDQVEVVGVVDGATLKVKQANEKS